MDAVTFLDKILPAKGIRFLAQFIPIEGHPKGGIFVHDAFGPDDNDALAHAAIRRSAKGKHVYFACSSYKEVIHKVTPKGKEYVAGREQSNVLAVQSLWLDIDVGKADPNKCYPTQELALEAVDFLVESVGLPRPLTVSSGAGLHVYWPLAKAVEPEQWKRAASMLASVCAHLLIAVDPSRTKDEASVLRVPGTTNPSHNRPVEVLHDAGPFVASDVLVPLVAFIKKHDVKVASPKSKSHGDSPNAALMGGIEYAPSSAFKIADHCAAVRHFRDVMGEVQEPYWYKMLGLLKHTLEGDAVCHEWSSGSQSYDPALCQAKIDQWTFGPTSCEQIEVDAGEHCKDCPHRAKLTSPISLGKELSSTEVVPVSIDASSHQATIPFRPEGFRWNGKCMVREVPDADGVINDVPFSDTLFYAVNRVRNSDGVWSLRLRMSAAGHEWREFDMPTELIADPRGMAKYMAQYEVLIYNPNPAQVYMRELVQLLMQHQQQTQTVDRFGWHEGEFIVGSTAFKPDGSTEPVLVSSNIVNARRAYDCTPKGELSKWVELIDAAYNRPNAEAFQFVICAYGFASALVPLMDFKNFRGIPIVLSGEGGIGKSSVFKAANTIYADANALVQDASTKGGATLQGILGMASLFNGVPLLFDELTERDDKEFTPIFYSLSNGIGKIRLTSGGQFAETVAPYAGIYGGTSNDPVTDKLYNAEKKDTADAANARCFEIGGLTVEGMVQLFGKLDIGFVDRLSEHHGNAAAVFIPYIIQHRDRIRELIIKTREKLGSDPSIESRERYYIDVIAFAFVAGSIAHKLGLIKWDVKVMTNWALGHLKGLRRSFTDRSASADDNLSLFLSWLHGNIIITKHFPSTKVKSTEVEVQLEPLRGKPKARLATVDKKFFISTPALTEWCKEYNQVPEKVRDQFKSNNLIVRESREYLGKGTLTTVGQSRVYEINYDMIAGNLHLISGGTNNEEEETTVEATHA